MSCQHGTPVGEHCAVCDVVDERVDAAEGFQVLKLPRQARERAAGLTSTNPYPRGEPEFYLTRLAVLVSTGLQVMVFVRHGDAEVQAEGEPHRVVLRLADAMRDEVELYQRSLRKVPQLKGRKP